MYLYREDASTPMDAMEYRHVAAAKSLFLACLSAKMPPVVFRSLPKALSFLRLVQSVAMSLMVLRLLTPMQF